MKKKRIIVISAILLVEILAVYFFRPSQVAGDSMYPTLKDSQLVFRNPIKKTIEKGDIVVAKTNYNKLVIKRVVGVSGDKLRIKSGYLYINDQKEERNIKTTIIGNLNDGVTVPEDHVYLMGDNRDHSRDSRDYGCVPISNVKFIVSIPVKGSHFL